MSRKAVYESLERFEQTMRASVLGRGDERSDDPADSTVVNEASADVEKYPVTRDELWDYVSAYATRKSLKRGQSVLVRATCPEVERIISTIKAMASYKHGAPAASAEQRYDVEPVQTGRLGAVCRVTRKQ